MIGTYSTVDFNEILAELEDEINRLKNCYCVYDYERGERINDYNRMTTALLILHDIHSR